MKGLNIKKLAAVATGAFLVGTALAPIVSAIDITKSDVYSADGSPAVNIVVGAAAQVSDVVWAGNIAAKIAEMATTSGSCTASSGGECTGDATASVSGLSVDLAIGGTTTYENAKTYRVTDLNSATPAIKTTQEYFGQVLTDSQLPNLINKSTTIKWSGTNYTRTFKEKIGVSADARFDVLRPAVQDLVLYMELEGDFNYTVDLGDGIPFYESTTSGTAFTDGTNDNVKIPFFGDEYLVSAATKGTNDYVKLLKSSAKETFNEGDVITGLLGKNAYDGQDMTVKVVQVIQVGAAVLLYQATFELYDAQGTLVDTRTVSASEYLNETFVDSNDDYALASTLYVDTVAIASTTNIGYVDILKGTSVVELYDAKIYPYDSSFTGTPDWKVKLTRSSDANYVTAISIVNSGKLWNDTHPLYPSVKEPAYGGAITTAGQTGLSEVEFLEGLPDTTDGKAIATLVFEGFETDESLTTITIGERENVGGYEVPVIKYKDSTDSSHTIPLYMQLSATTTGNSFTFDGQTIYYIVNKGDNDGDNISGTVDLNIDPQTILNANSINGCNVYMSMLAGNTPAGTSAVTLSIGGSTDINKLRYPAIDGSVIDLNGVAVTVADANTPIVPGAADQNNATLRFDGNIQFRKLNSSGDILTTASGVYQTASDNTTTTWYYDDLNLNGTLGPAMFQNPIWLEGANNKIYKYAMAVSETYNRVYLLLERTTNFDVQYNKDIAFLGTDRVEGGRIDPQMLYVPDTVNRGHVGTMVLDVNVMSAMDITTSVFRIVRYPFAVESGADANAMPYFYPDELEFGASSSDNSFMTAVIAIDTDDESCTATVPCAYDANVYIDTRFSEGKLLSLPNNNLSVYTSDVNINAPNVTAAATRAVDDAHLDIDFAMDEDSLTTVQPAKAYNDFGAKYEISSRVLKVTIPENRPKPVFIVKSKSTTSTTEGGETLTVAEGAMGSTSSGTQITVSKVNYTAACAGGTAGEVSCTASPASYATKASVPNPLVYLDRDAPIGPNVIVGGPVVNTLAAAVTGLADRLVAAGDYVAEVDTTTGDVIIAGYTAEDTGSAAQELIDAIDALG